MDETLRDTLIDILGEATNPHSGEPFEIQVPDHTFRFEGAKHRKAVLQALYKRFKGMGDAKLVGTKHRVMFATRGYQSVDLEDLSDPELMTLAQQYLLPAKTKA